MDPKTARKQFAFTSSGRTYELEAVLDQAGFSLKASCDGIKIPTANAVRVAPAAMKPMLEDLQLLDGCDVDGMPDPVKFHGVSKSEEIRRQLIDHVILGRPDTADRLLREAVSLREIRDAHDRTTSTVDRVFNKNKRKDLTTIAGALYNASCNAKDSMLPAMFSLRGVRSGYAALQKVLGPDMEHCGFPDISETANDKKGFEGLMSAVARQSVFFNAGVSGRGSQHILQSQVAKSVATRIVDTRLMPAAIAAWEARATKAAHVLSGPDLVFDATVAETKAGKVVIEQAARPSSERAAHSFADIMANLSETAEESPRMTM